MKRTKPFLLVFLALLSLSFVNLWRVSGGVRTVKAIGLFAGGVTAGAAVVGIVVTSQAKRLPEHFTEPRA